jgi:hypothetical protein
MRNQEKGVAEVAECAKTTFLRDLVGCIRTMNPETGPASLPITTYFSDNYNWINPM